MSENAAAGRLRVAMSEEGDRVTTLELFFDLVFVFAFTQVTALMAHGDAPMSLLHGFIVLSLLWFAWSAYAWLANQAHANEGVLQGAFVVVMVAVFVACLGIPEAFHEEPGGVPGAETLVVCYAIVRLAHLAVYYIAAGSEVTLRRRVAITALTSVVPTLALLTAGILAGEEARPWIWLAAVIYDFVAVYVGTRGGGWMVRSVEHFAERHGLIVILALGESIVAIGVGLGEVPLDKSAVAGAVLAICVAIGLWWMYFRRTLPLLERGIASRTGEPRARLAAEVFTYLHFPVIAGIVLAALGIEQAIAHVHDDHLGPLGGWALAAGLATTLTAGALAVARCGGRLPVVPLLGAAGVLAGGALLVEVPPLVALGLVLAVLIAVCVADEMVRPDPAVA